MTTPIDLSRLSRPEVPGLLLSVDEVHEELLDYLATRHDWAVTRAASDPAWRLTRLLAGREAVLRQAIADGLAQGSLAYATGQNLDHIGVTYYTLPRLAGEDNDRYRERLAGSFERYAVGLSGPWYESLARGVAGVADARVTTPSAGHVTIHVLADASLLDDMGDVRYPNGIPDQALRDAVIAVVTADENRQQTDTVTVSACTRQLYDVTVTLTLFAEPDSAAVLAAAESGLRDLARRAGRLAGAISTELIIAATVNVAAVSAASVVLAGIGVAALDIGAGNAAWRVVANAGGPGGNGITVEVEVAAAGRLGIAVAGEAVTVTPTAATTAAQVVAAVNADADAAALVTASLPAGADGSGVVAAAAEAALAGGRSTPATSIQAGDGTAPQARTLAVEAA